MLGSDLGSVMGCFEHDGAVAKFLDETVFALDGFDIGQCRKLLDKRTVGITYWHRISLQLCRF